MNRELTRLQTSGDFRVLRVALAGYDPARDGEHVLGLLDFMAKNGIEFAPAAPGDEAAYKSVFCQMRDLYVTVAAHDASIHRVDLTEGLE